MFVTIRLGWKGLPWKNTLAYYKHSINKDCKKFYITGPWAHSYKTFYGM